MDTHTKEETPPRSHFGNSFLIMNPPEKSFWELLSDQEGKPTRGSRVFEKPPKCCFTLNPGTAPLYFSSPEPLKLFWARYTSMGGGSPGGQFGGGGGVPGTSFPVAPHKPHTTTAPVIDKA